MTTLKNKTAALLSGLFALLCLLGCAPVYRLQMCPSFVVCYHNLRSIKTEVPEPESGLSNLIKLCHGSDLPRVVYALTSEGADKEEYDRLCRKHNDLGYNQYRSFAKELPFESVNYIDKDFLSIEVFSDTDYDAAHPAGSNLADLVRFMSWSPVKFINSGYSLYYQYNPADLSLSPVFHACMSYYHLFYTKEWHRELHPIDKMVSELTPDDLILLGTNSSSSIGYLYFEVSPTVPGEHGITIRMTCDTGEVFETTVVLPLR